VDPQNLTLTLSISSDGTLGQTPADYLGTPEKVRSTAAQLVSAIGSR
jgi:hypothetical protein